MLFQDPERLGLGVLVIKHLSETCCTLVQQCTDQFFTTVPAVDHMLEKQVYLTGTVMKNWATKAIEKLPSDKSMRGRGASAIVTRGDGTLQ